MSWHAFTLGDDRPERAVLDADTEAELLKLLSQHGGRPLSALSSGVHRSEAHTAQHLEDLQARGLVRHERRHNKRLWHLSETDIDRTLIDACLQTVLVNALNAGPAMASTLATRLHRPLAQVQANLRDLADQKRIAQQPVGVSRVYARHERVTTFTDPGRVQALLQRREAQVQASLSTLRSTWDLPFNAAPVQAHPAVLNAAPRSQVRAPIPEDAWLSVPDTARRMNVRCATLRRWIDLHSEVHPHCRETRQGRQIGAEVRRAYLTATAPKYHAPQQPDVPAGWLNIWGAQARLGCSYTTVYRMLEAGTLAAVRVSGTLHFDPEALSTASAKLQAELNVPDGMVSSSQLANELGGLKRSSVRDWMKHHGHQAQMYRDARKQRSAYYPAEAAAAYRSYRARQRRTPAPTCEGAPATVPAG